jgi:hypothetical protein
VLGTKHIILYIVIALIIVVGAWFVMRNRASGDAS